MCAFACGESRPCSSVRSWLAQLTRGGYWPTSTPATPSPHLATVLHRGRKCSQLGRANAPRRSDPCSVGDGASLVGWKECREQEAAAPLVGHENLFGCATCLMPVFGGHSEQPRWPTQPGALSACVCKGHAPLRRSGKALSVLYFGVPIARKAHAWQRALPGDGARCQTRAERRSSRLLRHSQTVATPPGIGASTRLAVQAALRCAEPSAARGLFLDGLATRARSAPLRATCCPSPYRVCAWPAGLRDAPSRVRRPLSCGAPRSPCEAPVDLTTLQQIRPNHLPA